MINVCIVYSETLGKHYTGISKFRDKRTRQHLRGQTRWSWRASDWTEIWHTNVRNMALAREVEKKIKARGARRFLSDLGVAAPPEAG